MNEITECIAAKTSRIGLRTGVTCPTVRCHPAIIARAAATLALSEGRFVLGVGSGKRLNEHAALERGYRFYEGKHLRLQDDGAFDLPGELPLVAVAASGHMSRRIVAELGDGLFATEDKPSIVQHYRGAGGTGPCDGDFDAATTTARIFWRG